MHRDQRRGYSEHPRTPDPYEKVPKRTFDGRVKAWRRQLHKWDLDHNNNGGTVTVSEVSENRKIEELKDAQQDNIEGEYHAEDIDIDDEDDVL